MKRAFLLLLLAGAMAYGQAVAAKDYVEIPAGSFAMGCLPTERCHEVMPVRDVRFDAPFWMMRTEVTVAQFRDFVRRTGHVTEAEKQGKATTWRNPGFAAADRQPVVFVSLDDAAAFCADAGGVVPTESQWEYAASAGATTRHFWGEEMDDRYVWHRGNAGEHPMAVGTKLANRWGLHDVEGNVWEWVRGGGEHTTIPDAKQGGLRGGSWVTCPDGETSKGQPLPLIQRTTFRFFRSFAFPAQEIRNDLGFRCVRMTKPN